MALLVLLLSACSVEILHDLDEGQANQVLAALSREGVAARKERIEGGGKSGAFAISVPRASAPQAWRVLRQQNLPRRAHKGLGEVFGKVGLIPTATQEQAMMRQAIAGELGRTLERLSGVLEARVHVVVPRRDRFNREPARHPRASVLLKIDTSSRITEAKVKKLVSGGVDGLKQEAVSVVIDRSSAESQPSGVAMVKVGPFLVSAESRGPLIAGLTVCVVLVVGLGLAVFLLARRIRRQPAVELPPPLVTGATGTRDAFVSQMNAMSSGGSLSSLSRSSASRAGGLRDRQLR